MCVCVCTTYYWMRWALKLPWWLFVFQSTHIEKLLNKYKYPSMLFVMLHTPKKLCIVMKDSMVAENKYYFQAQNQYQQQKRNKGRLLVHLKYRIISSSNFPTRFMMCSPVKVDCATGTMRHISLGGSALSHNANFCTPKTWVNIFQHFKWHGISSFSHISYGLTWSFLGERTTFPCLLHFKVLAT
jgi:hypothetical protein